MAALLHDRGALAVILADDDECTAGDPAGCEIGERIRCHVRADRRLEGGGPAQRVVDRSRERCGGGSLVGARLEPDPEFVEDLIGVGENVEEMRYRRALIAGDIGDARLQQRLGHRQDALAAELRAGAEAQLVDLMFERAFCHHILAADVWIGLSSRARCVVSDRVGDPRHRGAHARMPAIAVVRDCAASYRARKRGEMARSRSRLTLPERVM
jgi:hypothetical protein